MNRRHLLAAVASTVALAAAPTARAALVCAADEATGTTTCAVGVPTTALDGIYAAQQQTQWCWAATLHMVFRYYGYDVQQSRIVRETWGQNANVPAFMEQVIAATNRAWTADDGRSFRVRGAFFNVSWSQIGEDLALGNPVIVATNSHAMVLTSFTVVLDRDQNPISVDVLVRDPWPGNGKRSLTLTELQGAQFLRVAVYDERGTRITRTPLQCATAGATVRCE